MVYNILCSFFLKKAMKDEVLPDISIVLPVFNEQDCLDAVLPELIGTCALFHDYEIIAVNDCSTDGSGEILRAYASRNPRIRVFSLSANSGQSAALWTGSLNARHPITAMIDADGQIYPMDIAECVRHMENENADVCCGFRLDRQDSLSKRIGSRLANFVRRSILDDGIKDTGCPLKVFRTSFLRRLQYWDGMHRFLPALCQSLGAKVVQMPVSHRSRVAGASKYTNFGRLKVTMRDLVGVAWLKSRSRRFQCAEEAVAHA